MEENNNAVTFEKVLDAEIDEIWDIFFPHTGEKREKVQINDPISQTKPRRYLKFLTM